MNPRRLVVLLTVTALAAGCDRDAYGYPPPLPPLPPISTGLPPDPPRPTPSPTAVVCPAAGVRMEAGQADAASGLRALGVDLVNCGHRTYRVEGFPAVRVLDSQRKPLQVQVLRGVTAILGTAGEWTDPPRPVTLRPGQRATCVLAWRNTYDDIRQPPVNAAYLEMAPAAGRPAQVVAPVDPIDLGSTGRLGVSPWRVATPRKTVTPQRPTAPRPPPAPGRTSAP